MSNLLSILSTLTGEDVQKVAENLSGSGYGVLKDRVADCVVATLEPIQQEYARLMKDKGALQELLNKNAETAQAIALRTLRKVQKKVGFAAR